MAQTDKNPTIYICIAKAIIHISHSSPIFPQVSSLLEGLSIVKEIPSAISQISTREVYDKDLFKKQYSQMAV